MSYKCDKCNTNLCSKHSLNNHVTRQICVNKSSKYKCNKCSKIFSCKRRMEYHVNNQICDKNKQVSTSNYGPSNNQSFEIEK